MRYEMPTYFHEMRDMVAIRKTINACIRESHPRAVTALLRIRHEQHEARQLDQPRIRYIAASIPIALLFGAMIRPSMSSFALVGVCSVGWWLLVRYYSSRYPHRDEIDIPERERIDEMIRFALENISEVVDLSNLVLNNTEKKQILNLFADEPLPLPLRQALLRQADRSSFPDV